MKTIRLIVSVILAMFLLGSLVGCRENPAEQIKSQLHDLNQYSYRELKEWIDHEFDEFENFTLAKRAIDEGGAFLYSGFLDDEVERFIRWNFQICEEREELFIEIIYEEVNLVDELKELNQNSMEEIMEWIEEVEELGQDSGISLLITAVNIDGDDLGSDIVDMANQEIFVEWTFDVDSIGREIEVDIEFVFDSVRRFTIGDTFEHDGLEITTQDSLSWIMVEDSQSLNFGVQFFKVPITLTNISDRPSSNLLLRFFAPNGLPIALMDDLGADDNITTIDGLRPDETKSGYLYIRFDMDGDYIVELRDGSISTQIKIPMNSDDFEEERDALLESFMEMLFDEISIDLDIEFEPIEAEELIGRWVEGEGAIPLFVFGVAQVLEFHEDGTVLIIEDGVTSTESWELDEFGILSIRSFEFLVHIEDESLLLIDEWDGIRDWRRDI